MSDVLEPVGTVDRANSDLIDDDAVLVDTGDDELYIIRLETAASTDGDAA